jgi:16S rRNA (guanine966-N2)-methyltransferase
MNVPFRPKGARSTAASQRPPQHQVPKPPQRLPKIKPSKLRIIGGDKRGRGVWYHGDRATRPMKESLREALFNIVGPAIKGRIAWDLFSGTGILAIESFSRGAVFALAIERNREFAKMIRQSADAIDISSDQVEVLMGDSFRVTPKRMASVRDQFADTPWVTYFCPPYAMWSERRDDLFELLETTAQLAPEGSLIVTETDKFFDISTLPLGPWDVRPKGNMTLSFLETR